ncbi:hypothetical protein DIPPA_13875 [Diplonema papillatum]|nr:hypothetical protein DIPPA_13875 [Diplonema papillatum]
MLRDLGISGLVEYVIHSPGPPGQPEITEEELLHRQPDALARSRQAIRADFPANKTIAPEEVHDPPGEVR